MATNFGTFDFGTVDLSGAVNAFTQARQRAKQEQVQREQLDAQSKQQEFANQMALRRQGLSEAQAGIIPKEESEFSGIAQGFQASQAATTDLKRAQASSLRAPKVSGVAGKESKRKESFFKLKKGFHDNLSLDSAANEASAADIRSQFPDLYEENKASFVAANDNRVRQRKMKSLVGVEGQANAIAEIDKRKLNGEVISAQEEKAILAKHLSDARVRGHAEEAINRIVFKASDEMLTTAKDDMQVFNNGIKSITEAKNLLNTYGRDLTTGTMAKHRIDLGTLWATLRNEKSSASDLQSASERLDQILIEGGLGTLKLFGGNDSDRDVALALRSNPQITNSFDLIKMALDVKLQNYEMQSRASEVMNSTRLSRDLNLRDSAAGYGRLMKRTYGFGSVDGSKTDFISWRKNLVDKNFKGLEGQNVDVKLKLEMDLLNKWIEKTGQ